MTEPADAIPVIVEFDVRGLLRFASHAEMMRLFQRACVRAGIGVRHTQGFNPHPRMSLPLPRTVGVQSEGDVLFLLVESGPGGFGSGSDIDLAAFAKALSGQLPPDCRIKGVRVSDRKSPPRPMGASFVIPVKDVPSERQAAIMALLENDDIIVSRYSERPHKAKKMNIRPFLESFEFGIDGVTVRYAITGSGSVRLEEVLELLQITPEEPVGPVVRKNVRWN